MDKALLLCAYFGLAIIFALFCGVIAMLRRTPRARMRFFLVLGCAVLSFVITMLMKNALPNFVNERVMPQLVKPTGIFKEWVEKIPEELLETVLSLSDNSEVMLELVEKLLAAFVAPAVFMALFIALVVITWIVYLVLAIVLRSSFRKGKSKITHSLGYGVLQGILVFSIAFLPFVCYSAYISPVIEEGKVSGFLEEGGEYDEIVDMLSMADEAFAPPRAVGGKLMCNILMDIKLDNGKRIKLTDDIDAIAALTFDIANLGGELDVVNFGHEEAVLIKKAAYDVGRSELVMTAVADILHSATGKWMNGDDFMGMEKPELGEMGDPLVDQLIGILNTDSASTELLRKDIDTTAELVAIFAENNIFSVLGGSGDIIDAFIDTDNFDNNLADPELSGRSLVYKVIYTVGKNDSMRVLIGEVTDLGIRAVANGVDLPENNAEIYNSLIYDIAETLTSSEGKSAEERQAQVADGLYSALNEAGVFIDDAQAEAFAMAMIKDTAGASDASALRTAIKEFFKVYSQVSVSVSSEVTPMSAEASEGYTYLTEVYARKSVSELKSSTYAGCLAVYMFEASKIDDAFSGKEAALYQRVSEAFAAVLSSVDGEEAMRITGILVGSQASEEETNEAISNISSLTSAEDMETANVTVDKVMSSTNKNILDAESVKTEAEAFDNILVSAAEFMDKIDQNNGELPDIKELGGLIGGMFNELRRVPTIGKDAAGYLFIAILQLADITDIKGFSARDIYELAYDVAFNLEDYEKAFDAVSLGMDMGKSLSENNLTTVDDVTRLIEVATPEMFEIVDEYLTSDRLREYGYVGDKAETTQEVVSLLIKNVANHDKEQRGEDVEAVKNILNIAIISSEKNYVSGDVFGEDGELGDAEELVAAVMGSELGYETLVDGMTENGEVKEEYYDAFGVGSKLSESDKEVISSAVGKYVSENADKELEGKALLALFNIR